MSECSHNNKLTLTDGESRDFTAWLSLTAHAARILSPPFAMRTLSQRVMTSGNMDVMDRASHP